jgi:hypothetical protein
MSAFNYPEEQMKKLLPIDIFKVSIKMRSSSGETHWMTLDWKCMATLRVFYSQHKTELNKEV